jgi:dolichol kinase
MEPTTNGSAVSLEQLVVVTEGFQPFRKLFHATNAALISAALLLLDLSQTQASLALGTIFLVLFIGDLIRLNVAAANVLFFRVFRRLASPRDAEGMTSSTWYALGVFLVVAVTPMHIAISAILVLGFCDPLASYVGVRWGRRPFLAGTLEGSAAFVILAASILLFRHPPAIALSVAVVAGLVERRSWPLDDNLTVPVVCAALLTWLGA